MTAPTAPTAPTALTALTEIQEAVGLARPAAAWWAALGAPERRRRLLTWNGTIARRLDELAEVVRSETGKPIDDARLEVALALGHVGWAARNARRVLRRRRVASGLATLDQAASVEYLPLGVVGVIGPWNHPVFTPLGAIAHALAAGNAVLFKPSQYTPAVADWLLQSFRAAVPEQPVLQIVGGDGAAGAALCASGVDKIAFTGSTATAKKVMAQCASTLTPLVAECGGKDTVIVAADADLDEAAQAVVWGAMNHSGQNCVGIERALVEDPVYDGFLARVTAVAGSLRAGGEREAHYGPVIVPAQLEVISRHVREAVEAGGTAVVGGPESVRPPYVDPVVLTDVPDTCAAAREETFGPVLVVGRVRDLDEAVDRANATGYGLGASVFTRDRRTAARVARRLRVGAVAVNSVITFAAVPSLPFGGTGDSGFGRVHGADGLREFSRPHAIARRRFRSPLRLLSFARSRRDMEVSLRLTRLLHGRS
ncbi:aldehyde dehydrogenase family protein [Streptomyces sp.]|uniref:aldehyde dehydrogenase family protein n=1 Tax=Streptomyces sp. TaxID=1931 RepID=UPI002F404464